MNETILTAEEISWCKAFADKIGLEKKDLIFNDYACGIQKVTFILKKKCIQYSWYSIDSETGEQKEDLCRYIKTELTLELQKFYECERLVGWSAFLNRGGHTCFLHGDIDNCKASPAKAVLEIVKMIRRQTEKLNKQAEVLETGL